MTLFKDSFMTYKITRATVWKEDLTLTRPYTIAFETIDAVENLFICIETEEGLAGIGTASPSEEVTGETLEQSETALRAMADMIEGKDLRLFQGLLKTLNEKFSAAPAALAAADIALHDLAGNALGLPLVDLLGRVHQSLPTSITIGIMPLEETLQEAEEYLGRGFKILKVKTGLDVEEDIERVLKIHERYGAAFKIRVDANMGYTTTDYERFFKATGHCVEFVEQPLGADQIREMAGMPEDLRQFGCADESLLRPADVAKLLAPPRPFGIFNIKLMKCGGVANGRDIARTAAHAGIHLMWGCMDESIVSISAALHAALASRATRYLDLDGSLDLAKDIVTGGFMLKDGKLSTLDKPGLGVTRI